jgi:hypothetical protein
VWTASEDDVEIAPLSYPPAVPVEEEPAQNVSEPVPPSAPEPARIPESPESQPPLPDFPAPPPVELPAPDPWLGAVPTTSATPVVAPAEMVPTTFVARAATPIQQDVLYVPLAVSVGDGFKFGCGFFMALILAVLVGFVLFAALFVLTSMFGLNLPITR